MGIEDAMQGGADHSQTVGATSSQRPVKKGFAGYNYKPRPGYPGGDPGYKGVKFRDTKGGSDFGGLSFGGTPMDSKYLPKTDAEQMEYRDNAGIAKTSQNMGSLAVQGRADDAITIASGGVTASQKRASDIRSTRRIDKTKRVRDMYTARDAFKRRYFKAREDWTEGLKGREAKRSKSVHTGAKEYSGPARGLTKTRGFDTPNANAKFGLF